MPIPANAGTPPSPDAPVLIAPPADDNPRAYLLAVRRHLDAPPRLTTTWRSRPAAVVVLDGASAHTAVRALASGVPVAVLDQPGVAGLVADNATGRLVADADPATVAATIDAIRTAPDSSRAMATHAVEQARIANDPAAVVERFHEIAKAAIAAESGLHEVATSGRLRPVPPPGASF